MAENGRIVTNEKTGEQAWWDGTRLTPIRIEGNVQPADVAAGVAGQTAPLGPEAANLPSPPEAPPRKPRPTGPTFPSAERFIQQITGPALTTAAGLLPGGRLAQAGIGAGTELVGELASGQPISPTKIGLAAATPALGEVAGQVLKPIARAGAKIFGSENLAKGAIGKVESGLGKKAAQAAEKSTLEAAKAVQAPVVQSETGKVVSDILAKRGRIAGTDPQALQTAEEVVRNAVGAAKAGDPLKYNEVFEQAKNMRTLATKAKGPDKEAFINLREAMLKDLDAVGPEAREAVRAYRRSAAIDDMTEALQGPTQFRKIEKLFSDPLIKGVFNKEEQHLVETVAKHVGSVGLTRLAGSLASLGALGYANPPAALVATLPAVIMSALVSSPKVGSVVARSLVGPEGKINKTVMPGLAMLVRGYMATQGEEQ